jgi:acetate kinase
LKFELFMMPDEHVEVRGQLQRVTDHRAALEAILDGLAEQGVDTVDAVGHRVVHGGERFRESALIDTEVERAIERCSPLAPLHNPANLQGIDAARAALPGVPQVAVFDTAFHQTMPPHAFRYALPDELYREHGIRRYGFHGTSHRFVAGRAAELLARPPVEVNLITCHLGNGCSMAAVRGGQSVDTTMGLTPLEGLVMGTRSGDVDPAIPSFLARERNLPPDQVEAMLNNVSGLLGLSGISNDVRDLLAAEASGEARAALALDVYAYRIRKTVGAYAAVLGRVHALVFTAGVGENAPAVRQRVLAGLEPLGFGLDAARNRRAVGREADVASPSSRTRILVVPTDEELVIARDTYAVVSAA